jgi:hypothetical protein
MKRVAPAPSDAQLAAAEQTDTIRRRDRIAAIEDQQEDERLALAGDPEAQNRMAIRASASVLGSTPIPPEEPKDDELREKPTPALNIPAAKTAVQRRKHKSSDPNSRHRREPQKHQTEVAPALEEEPLEEVAPKLAWRLMDTAYKKWKKTAQKDLRKANHDLALDLGGDAVLYLRNDIIRLTDLHSTIEKLTAAAKVGKDGGDSDEDFDDEMEEFRKQLRGDK